MVETTPKKLDTLRSDAETKALVTDILWGATLASAVVTTVLLLTGSDDDDAATAHATFPRLHVDPSGIAVVGRF